MISAAGAVFQIRTIVAHRNWRRQRPRGINDACRSRHAHTAPCKHTPCRRSACIKMVIPLHKLAASIRCLWPAVQPRGRPALRRCYGLASAREPSSRAPAPNPKVKTQSIGDQCAYITINYRDYLSGLHSTARTLGSSPALPNVCNVRMDTDVIWTFKVGGWAIAGWRGLFGHCLGAFTGRFDSKKPQMTVVVIWASSVTGWLRGLRIA